MEAMVLTLLANTFVTQKFESGHFYSCPQAKLSPRFWSFLPRQNKISHFLQKTFCEDQFLPQQKGGRGGEGGRMIMELKKLPKLNLRGYWSYVLINSTIFSSFTFLISVLLCQNLASSIMKCDDSLIQLIKFSLKSVVCRNNYKYNLALSYSLTILPTICQTKSLFLHFFSF